MFRILAFVTCWVFKQPARWNGNGKFIGPCPLGGVEARTELREEMGCDKGLSHSHRELWRWDGPAEWCSAGRGSQAFVPLHHPVLDCRPALGGGVNSGEAAVFC